MDLDDEYFLTDSVTKLISSSCKDVSCQCDLKPEPRVVEESTEDSTSLSVFDALPTELQYKILSYLRPAELCCSVAPVCKRWYQLAYEPLLWQRLQFVNDVPVETVAQILERTPLVRQLELCHFTEVWDMISRLVNCKLLQDLDLRRCGGITVSVVSLLVAHCPLVEALNVEGCRTIDCAVVAQIVGWKRLKRLNLSHCTSVRNDSILMIATDCHCLLELNIDGLPSISDSAMLALIDRRKSTLQKLYLDGDELTDVTYEALVCCPHLIELSISFAELMSDVGLMAIKELKSLQQLKVRRGSELSEGSLRNLFEGTNLQKLSCLDLSSCSNFDDIGVETMTKCCPNLKTLGLAWCWDISDRGLEAIVNGCKFLEVLDVVGLVKITGACLARIPFCLPNLIFLDLRQCSRIMDDIIEDVVTKKTDLKILNYYGETLTSEGLGSSGECNCDKCEETTKSNHCSTGVTTVFEESSEN